MAAHSTRGPEVATGAPAGGPANDGRVVLANQHVRLGVRPGLGAKVDSLAYRPVGREWLITPRAELPGRHVYGSAFTGTTPYGWDEMLPTADPMADYYDDLGRACRDGKVLVVPPGRAAERSIRMTFGRS